MHSEKIAIVFFASFALAFFLSGCSQQPVQKFRFEWEHDGLLFASDYAEPKALLRAFSIKPKVILLAELSGGESTENPEIFNKSFIPFYAVVAGNDRNAIQLIMFVEGGNTKECQSNFGDLKTQVFLNANECAALLERWNEELVIRFQLPDSSLGRSFVLLEENKAVIKARNISEQAALSSALAEQLFPNAQEILEGAKEKLKELG